MLFSFIMQVIDSFHYKNHTDPECKVKYNPSVVRDKYPNVNLMCCEQTFIWLSSYKKIVCAMSKNHHLFFCIELLKGEMSIQSFVIIKVGSHFYLKQRIQELSTKKIRIYHCTQHLIYLLYVIMSIYYPYTVWLLYRPI